MPIKCFESVSNRRKTCVLCNRWHAVFNTHTPDPFIYSSTSYFLRFFPSSSSSRSSCYSSRYLICATNRNALIPYGSFMDVVVSVSVIFIIQFSQVDVSKPRPVLELHLLLSILIFFFVQVLI